MPLWVGEVKSEIRGGLQDLTSCLVWPTPLCSSDFIYLNISISLKILTKTLHSIQLIFIEHYNVLDILVGGLQYL